MYGEKGWRSIENFIFQYFARPEDRDDVNAIVEKINEQLKSAEVLDFLRQMGLLSVGYLLDSPWASTFQFFRGGEEDGQHYSTPYIWKDRSRSDRFSDLIHGLFLVVRDEQRKRLRSLGHHSEEFYVRLPHIRSSGACTDRAYYCAIGELLFWLYAWRLLWYFEHLVAPAAPFEAGRVLLDHGLQDPAAFTWCDRKIVAADVRDATDALNLASWAAEYRVLCLIRDEHDSRTPWVGAIEAYVQASVGVAGVPGNDLAALDASLQRATADWLARVVPEEERQSCKAARLWMEAHAPAPLLPYYFWIGLDRWPKTYLVCPIWVSALYPTKVRQGEDVKDTPIVGLALCGVSPLSAWDSTLTDELMGGDFGVRPTAKHTLIEFLTLLGQPAVELHFSAELRRAERERITARHAYVLRRGLIHEIGQLTQMVLLWGMGTVAERQIVAECTVMKLASEALAEILNVGSYENEKSCGEIVEKIKAALTWLDLKLEWELPPDWMECLLPTPLEYVLIELGRNAYHHFGPKPADSRTVCIAFTRSDDSPRIQTVSVKQSGVLTDPAIDTDVDPDPEKPETGIEVVRYIVKQVVKGHFVLKQEGGFVIAYVERLGSNHSHRTQAKATGPDR
jgi:hypothetical protein